MGSSGMCVAGIDLASKGMARPHSWNKFNWPRNQYPALFEPGAVVQGRIRSAQESGPLPHRNEDVRLTDPPTRIGTASPGELFAACSETAVTSIAAGLGLASFAGRFVHEGTDCASLFGLQVSGEHVTPFEKGKFQQPGTDLRCLVRRGLQIFNLKITALAADSPAGRTALRARIEACARREVVIRVGLARGLPNTTPPECYLQVNGFVFPPDS